MSQGQYSDAQTYFERALELREKAKAPAEMADTLHNLGETLTKMGRYEQALQRYRPRARAAAERRRQAQCGHRVLRHRDDFRLPGTLRRRRQVEGGGAQDLPRSQAARRLARRDSQRLWQQPEPQRTVGRCEAKSLDEALTLARELKNQNLIAQTLRFEADRLYYSGDARKARPSWRTRPLQAATRASDRSLTLLAQATSGDHREPLPQPTTSAGREAGRPRAGSRRPGSEVTRCRVLGPRARQTLLEAWRSGKRA